MDHIDHSRELKDYKRPSYRGFQPVADEFRLTEGGILMPKRGTKNSAAYDFFLQEDIEIDAFVQVKFFSDVKAYMQPHEVLLIFVRSSTGIKEGLRLANGTGIIDSDYYNNPDNDGNIGFTLVNTTPEPKVYERGTRLCQGMFTLYLIADDDDAIGERNGGWGHTGK